MKHITNNFIQEHRDYGIGYRSLLRFLIPIYLIPLFLIPYTSSSQPISKGEFKRMFTQANLMMLDNFYDTAVKTFLKLNTADPSNANINYKIGVCYMHLPTEKLKAIAYLENAIKQTNGSYREDDPSEKNAPEDAMYMLGQAYHYAYRFDEAMEQFKKFRDLVGKWNLGLVKEIDQRSGMSKNAKELIAKPVECTITNLGDSVNCQFADYSPVISADEEMLAFTSLREGTGGPNNKTVHDEFYEDIWACRRGPYGTWQKAKSISKTINTDGNEASIGLSADGQQLYVYRDDNGDGNIYVSKLDGDYWNAPYKMDASNINSPGWEPSACISADGNTMYFVSNRAGGLGGRDIYQCHRFPNRTWSAPENLGPTINTPYDEDAPFIHPDGITFFFSSTGHNSMGGFDVFYSTKVANTVWTDPINMGYPINTTDDDIYFVTSSDGRRAYYSSFRPEGKGEKDIYMVSMPKPFVKSVGILVGWLKNKDGSPIPKNSLVTAKSIRNTAEGSSIEEISTNIPNEASGKFLLSLFPGRKYDITVETNGSKIFTDNFFLPEDSSYQSLGRGFFLRTLYVGDTTHWFSMYKVKDTTARTQMMPMEGKILLNQNPNDVAANATIQLLNLQGNIIASAVTDSKGNFRFQNVPSNQNYIIKIDEKDALLKTHNQFFLANVDGKIIMASIQDGIFFLFKNVAPDINKVSPLQVKDSLLTTVMTGKLVTGENGKTGLAKATVNLADDKGKIIQTKMTDKFGRFSFESIPNKGNYTVSIKEDDPSLKNNQKLYLANQRDELIKKVSKLADYFVFENLPSDLNKVSAISMEDDTKLIAMKGKVLKSNDINDGIGNIGVTLFDSKGKAIQKTKTDTSGMFGFEKLSADQNYTVKLNNSDLLLSGLKKVYLSNEADKVIQVIDLGKKGSAFKNLSADLMQMGEWKEAFITSANKDSVTAIIHKNVMYPGDEKFDFVVYFPYNKKEIDIAIGSFFPLMEKVAKTINEKGNATIIIAASSSTVPTKSFTNNEELANARSNEIKDKVRASMSLKNIDASQISYEIDVKVMGPAYDNDAMQNRKKYERWQFVKVIVK